MTSSFFTPNHVTSSLSKQNGVKSNIYGVKRSKNRKWTLNSNSSVSVSRRYQEYSLSSYRIYLYMSDTFIYLSLSINLSLAISISFYLCQFLDTFPLGNPPRVRSSPLSRVMLGSPVRIRVRRWGRVRVRVRVRRWGRTLAKD